jgi:hypothetical protein
VTTQSKLGPTRCCIGSQTGSCTTCNLLELCTHSKASQSTSVGSASSSFRKRHKPLEQHRLGVQGCMFCELSSGCTLKINHDQRPIFYNCSEKADGSDRLRMALTPAPIVVVRWVGFRIAQATRGATWLSALSNSKLQQSLGPWSEAGCGPGCSC